MTDDAVRTTWAGLATVVAFGSLLEWAPRADADAVLPGAQLWEVRWPLATLAGIALGLLVAGLRHRGLRGPVAPLLTALGLALIGAAVRALADGAAASAPAPAVAGAVIVAAALVSEEGALRGMAPPAVILAVCVAGLLGAVAQPEAAETVLGGENGYPYRSGGMGWAAAAACLAAALTAAGLLAARIAGVTLAAIADRLVAALLLAALPVAILDLRDRTFLEHGVIVPTVALVCLPVAAVMAWQLQPVRAAPGNG